MPGGRRLPVRPAGARVARDRDLGTRQTFADLGQTIADNFGLGGIANGTSFLREIIAG